MPDDAPLAGLTEAEAAARLAADGPNDLPRPERRSLTRIAVEVLREPMFALLLAAGAVYLVLGEPRDALVLLAFATLSVGIALVQEVRSERVLEALRDLSSPTALVIRGGLRRRIPARDVVRGDLIAVGEGDRAPADARLRRSADLHADESLLTGESAPVEKAATQPAAGAAVLMTEPGTIYAGSLIVRGSGVAEVVETGGRTRMGRIGAALQDIRPEATRLTQETRRLVRIMGLLAGAVCLAVVLIAGLQGHWLEGLLGGLALGMAMIPEEFPLVLTVFMVMGAWRISRAGVLTRRAAAIESLGSATVLCTDKTGTLTENRMAVVGGWREGRHIEAGASGTPDPDLARLIRLGVLASAPDPFDPMERAFHAAHEGAEADAELVRAYGLRPDLLAVTQVWAVDGERVAAAKGAPEAIVDLCRLAGPERARALKAAETMAARGMRVLGVAEGRAGAGLPDSARGLELSFVGLVGLADPLRPDVPAAVRACREAGVRVVMITGDHPATAAAIAGAAGIVSQGVISGAELAALSDEALAARARTVAVFARIQPEQKLRIVRALKAAGEVVAMTGDGVNDAPALKAADIGVAMGQRGSDVAREAASLVLLQDGFAAIVETIRLGRRIYDNLRRSMGFILAVHAPIAGLALVPLIAGGQVLLGPVHIALLEMFIDPMCAVAFEAEPADADLMRRPPRDPRQRLFSGRELLLAGVRGGAGLLAVLAVYGLSLWRDAEPDQTRTAAFLALVAVDIALVLCSRLLGGRRLAGLLRPNPTLWGLLGGLVAVLAAALTIPAARAVFRFAPVGPLDLAAAAAAGLAVLGVGLALSAPRGRVAGPRSAAAPG